MQLHLRGTVDNFIYLRNVPYIGDTLSFNVDGNVLEFRMEVPEGIDLDEIEAKAQADRKAGKEIDVKREDGRVVITYRAKGKTMEYAFSDREVKGKVVYDSPISDPNRALESQERIIREYWLSKAKRDAGEESPIRRAIIEAARKLYEDRGVPPSARDIAKALGYKSPRVLYGTDRFSSLKEIYEAAGIPVEPRSFPAKAEEVEAEGAEVELEPIPGYRLEARIAGNYLYKVVEVEVLGQKLTTEMKFPLKGPMEVCKRNYKVRIVPTPKGPVIEMWRRIMKRRK